MDEKDLPPANGLIQMNGSLTVGKTLHSAASRLHVE
jgi:hypothetical protein